jgi:hypothetical protein
MLSIDPEEFEAGAQIGKEHGLRFDVFLASSKKTARRRIARD